MSAPVTSTKHADYLARSLSFVANRTGMTVAKCEQITDKAAATLRALAAERDGLGQTMAAMLESHIQAVRERDAARAEVAALREALEFYARDHKRPNEGPWGHRSTDFGTVALAALVATKPKGTAR